MSKRTDRRDAERAARKLACQLRPSAPAAEPVIEPVIPSVILPANTSDAQRQANRTNAQLSRGPVTAEGKAISSRNNTRHGLSGEADGDLFRVLTLESQQAYDQSLAGFRAEWNPATATEHNLVNRMVMHQWLCRRALRLLETLFDPQTGDVADAKKFELYRRYENSHERGFNKAFADIQRLRAFQVRQVNGFESQIRKNTVHEFKISRLKRIEEEQIYKLNRLQQADQARAQHQNAS